MTLMDFPMTTTSAPPVSAPARLPLPVLPDSAPFTASQRGWLNGFFAGLLNTQTGAPGGATSATSMSEAPAPQADAEEEFPWHDPAIAIDERLKLAEGRPHARVLMAAMAQLDCGACGYECKTYAEAIAAGDEKDLTRCTPGGRDTAKMLKQLAPATPAAAQPGKAAAAKAGSAPSKTRQGASSGSPSTSPDSAWGRNNPFPARLLKSVRLNGSGSAKDTRLVTLDLKGSGLTYKVGDALGVYPENCADEVGEVIEALGATGAEEVCGWDGQAVSLFEALLHDYTITRPTPGLIELMTERATDPAERDALITLRDDADGPAPGVHVVDLLRRFPSARPSADNFVTALSPLAPRLYSISSSLRACPGEVHLTVGAVRYTNAGGRACKGVASTYLADRVRPGVRVRVFVHPSHKFGLCEGDRPIIMVGPGTGIAPFRAFLQERAAAGATGKSWLFFGDQRSACDFLYRDELEGYLQDGVLTRLDTAFSRDQPEKVYVQDRMMARAHELWEWLQLGACFYVCGDAKRMAADVDQALRRIIAEQGKLPAAAAEQFVAAMVREGRYQRDVY
jgi:sulfite reductase (NADPH) flavoprotein alpha-component